MNCPTINIDSYILSLDSSGEANVVAVNYSADNNAVTYNYIKFGSDRITSIVKNKDGNNNLLNQTEQVVSYTGNVISETDEYGVEKAYTYNGYGDLLRTTLTDADGKIIMIEFQGKITQECRQYIQKRVYGKSVGRMAIFLGLLMLPLLFLAAKFPLGLIAVGIDLLAFIMFVIPQTNLDLRDSAKKLPTRIVIENGKILKEAKGKEDYVTKDINKAKKVIDMGEWYVINFSFLIKDQYFVCEKALLTQGTVEEFEELFKDYIIVK